MPLQHRTVACLAALLTSHTCAAWTGNQISTEICTWEQLRAGIIRDTVYLDGGSQVWQQTFSGGVIQHSSDGGFSGTVMTLDLGTAFDSSKDNLTALFSDLSKTGTNSANNVAPNYVDGVMFANDGMFWLYGGLPRNTSASQMPPGNTILGYEAYQYGQSASMWSPAFINSFPTDLTTYVTNGAGVTAPSENLGFYVAGLHGPGWGAITSTDNQATLPSNRMIKVDMSDMSDPVWSNVSLPSYVPSRANAEAVWVPVSESGAVVVIGGVVDPEVIYHTLGLNSNQTADSKKQSPGFMETVAVYDVAGDKWYLQATSGDTPPQLTQFCSTYASASDGSSHNIYIYGGYDGIDPSTTSDDVYVLSLPSFQWIKLYTGQSAHSRKGHRCVKPYPDQMFALGGTQINPYTCLDMIQVFNLNTGKFQDTYNSTVWNEYSIPDLVTAQIGGDGKGGATKTKPDSWTNSSLAAVFSSPYTKTIATFYPYQSSNTSTTSVTPTQAPSSHGGSSFPPWAGAIIGVLLGLLLFAGALIFWLLRRRKKNPKSRRASEASGPVSRWLRTSGPEAKDAETVVSANETVQTIPHSEVTEVENHQVYEMHDQSTTPPIELPTSYNVAPFGSPITVTSPQSGYHLSPVSPELPAQENMGPLAPARPTHTRNMSSISSGTSDDGRASQRPRYLSGVSDISSEGTSRLADVDSRLENIQDTEGSDDLTRHS